MVKKELHINENLSDYIVKMTLNEPEVLRKLREETSAMPNAMMQISPLQGQFMSMLVKISGAIRVIEIGTFTGYSSLSIAMALPDNGYMIACDMNSEWTKIARHYWKKAGVDHKIDLCLAPALVTLDNLIFDGLEGSFDFIFIDADKLNYVNYYEKSLQLLRSGGLVVVDNSLAHGSVYGLQNDYYGDPGSDEQAAIINWLNEIAGKDGRVEANLLPIGDGLLIARKK